MLSAGNQENPTLPYSNQISADRSAAKDELSSELTESSAARYMP
jgi:hypothetical protein